MIKTTIKFLLLHVCLMVLSSTTFAQHYPKDFLSHKIMVNLEDRTIETYVKPVKANSAYSDRYYYWFSGKLIQITQGGYGGKLLNGTYTEYDLNHNLMTSGLFSAGLKTGIWKSWTADGKLIDDYTWKLGKKNGLYHKYDSLGMLNQTGKFKNDLLQGKQLSMVGDSIVKVRYKKGKVYQPKSILPKFVKRLF